ncbi:hypothetical protein Tco_0810565 [Tanacetum coccineum]
MKMEILLEPASNKLLDNLKMEMEMEIPSVKASANSDIVYFFTSAQDGDPLQDNVRLCLGNDLKKGQDHNQRQVKDESKDHYPKLFILPTRILLDIEQLVRGFLWCHGDMRRGKAKVSWEVVCLPKKEGGLGLRRLELFNKALMVLHIWKLLVRKESLWVK